MFLCFLLVVALALPKVSGAAQPDAFEQRMLDLINAARRDPLGTAAGMGLDTEKILEQLPGMSDILTRGLLPVAFNETLYAAAAAHTGDMLASDYYNRISPDGRTPADRMQAAGYQPAESAEALGLLGFENFIEPEKAVQVLFENLFKGELDPNRTEKRVLLNPDLREGGVSLQSGVLVLNNVPWNVYLVAADFAVDRFDRTAELGLLTLINSVRNNPAVALKLLGIDEAAASETLGPMAWILETGLPPLVEEDRLLQAALGHNQDMLTHLYFNSISLDGLTPADRIEQTGYEAEQVAELLGADIGERGEDPLAVARQFFEKMLSDELVTSEASDGLKIFNPVFSEVGIGFSTLDFEIESVAGSFYLYVADLADPVEAHPFITGAVFEDVNGNDVYEPEEGIAGLRLSLTPVYEETGKSLQTETTSGLLGYYRLAVKPFVFYTLTVSDAQDHILFEQVVIGDDQNVLRNLAVDVARDD